MSYQIRTHYSIRVPFPDEDQYCFVLDKSGKVSYYEHRDDAEQAAWDYENAIVVETQYYGF